MKEIDLRSLPQRPRLFLVGGICISVCCLAILVSCSRPTAPAATPVSTAVQPTEEASTPIWPPLTPELTPIPTTDAPSFRATVYAVMLTLPTMTPYGGQPDEKTQGSQMEDLYIEAAATVVAMQHLVPILAPYPTPVPPLTPYPGLSTRIAGAGTIIETNLCGLNKLIGARNEWSEIVSNQITGICAGTRHSGPPQGQILVQVFDAETNAIISGPDLYTAPAQVEWVKVIDAVGERVTLQADTGALFYFDVPTRQWVSPPPLPSVSPVLSPLPTISPLPTLPSP